MRLVVVAVANVGGSYEEFKGVILLYVQRPVLYFFLQLSHSFLPMTAIGGGGGKGTDATITHLRLSEIEGNLEIIGLIPSL